MPDSHKFSDRQLQFALQARTTLRELRDEAQFHDMDAVVYFLEMTYLMLSEQIAKSTANDPSTRRGSV